MHLEVCRADLGALPPAGDAPLILLGGPFSAIDAFAGRAPAWLAAEVAWLSACLARDAPVFAICLGAQLLAGGLGAPVLTLPTPETGWTTIRFADPAAPHELDMLQWHDDGFALPGGATALAAGDTWPAQMFAAGPRRVAMQFHPEWNSQSLAALHDAFGAACPLPPPGRAQDAARFAASSTWLWQRLDAWWQESART